MSSALGDEPDLDPYDPGAAQELGAAGQEAKQIKDDKDVEKLTDA